MKSRQSKNTFTPALLAALLAAGSAGAVNLSTDGTGQVLIYPYYTTRNGFVTSLNVTNHDPFKTSVARVAFQEAKAGATVMSFNIWLRPRDSWNASIIDRGPGAGIYTTDPSCTSPQVPGTTATAQPFVNFYYAGQVQDVPYDNGGTSVDRTKEGYVEIIEMGVMADGADEASSPATAQGTSTSNAAATQDCAKLRVNFNFNNGVDVLQPSGRLSGSLILINVATGVEFAQRAVALQNFYVPAGGARTSLYANPGSETPNLSSVSPARSVILQAGAVGSDVLTITDWVAAGGQPIDAVTAVLSSSSLGAEFDVTTGLRSEAILTQPTKRFYVSAPTAQAAASAPAPAVGPFNQLFASALAGEAKSCDRAVGVVHDSVGTVRATAAAPESAPQLCWAVSTMTFSRAGDSQTASTIFGSPLAFRSELPAGVERGQAFLVPVRDSGAGAAGGPGQSSTDGRTITSTAAGGVRNLAIDGKRVRGLPVVGFIANQGLFSGQGYGGVFSLITRPNVSP